jgi:hypothetical protein
MGRRKARRRRNVPPQSDAVRRVNPGAHWRADGTPKAGYRSQAEALSVADERRHDTGLELTVYRCDVCSSWHMGNAEGRR